MVTALGLNIVAGDQYIAIVLPTHVHGRVPQSSLHPETLATAVNSGGASPLILELMRRLHVGCAGCIHIRFLPYCFFNFANFLLGMIYGFFNINIMHGTRSTTH
jgi:NhaC family Na+:H+ antiporter